MKQYINNFMKYRELLKELVSRDLKTKYRRSVLGFLWSVLNPLGIMIVLTIVFSSVFRQNIENFPVYLMCGQLIFNFFNEATTMAMNSITGNGDLIKKVYLPKYLFPVSRVCSSLVNLLTSFVALLIVILVTRMPITWTIILMIFPVLYVWLFALGIGVLLSAVVVSFRDLEHLYSILTIAWMYLTPVFYPMSMLPDIAVPIVSRNPMTIFVQMLREVVMYNTVPSLGEHIACICIVTVTLIIGFTVFKKSQDTFVLKL